MSAGARGVLFLRCALAVCQLSSWGDLMLIVLLCSSMLQPLILNYTVPHAMPAIDMCGSCAYHPGAIGSAGCKHGTVGRQGLGFRVFRV